VTAESIEYFTGRSWKELSECQSWFAVDELLVGGIGDATVERDVADVDQLLVAEARRGAGRLAKPRVERAEALRERDLLGLGERLVAEDEHREAVHRLLHRGDVGVGGVLELHAHRVRGERGSDWGER
jgi:hypothetical protein